MTWIIRPARATDLPAIVAIYNSTIESRASTADLAPVSVASRQAWFAAHHGNRPLYVVEDTDGTIAAWGSFSDYYPRAAYRISAEISIYVAPERRGNGLGRKLLQEMLQRAPALGIKNVLAVIFAHNAASIALLQSQGFVEWGRLPQVCDLQTRLADIVILGKAVN